jgi:putative glutamine amidotransferase
MHKRPLILVSPSVEKKGVEFGDLSSSLSRCYDQALVNAGALPLTLPITTSREVIAECVQQADGVMLTGGDDIEPRLYGNGLPKRIRRTVSVSPDGGERDFRELLLIDEVFRQRKPLLAICRGHQMLNVALGGTLLADIPQQAPKAFKHNRFDKRNDLVHEVQLTPGSLLAKITGVQKLGVSSTHHQAVGRVAAPLTVTARSRDGVVEGLELRPGSVQWLPFLVSVQFHPERLEHRYPEHRAIFRAFAAACAANGK